MRAWTATAWERGALGVPTSLSRVRVTGRCWGRLPPRRHHQGRRRRGNSRPRFFLARRRPWPLTSGEGGCVTAAGGERRANKAGIGHELCALLVGGGRGAGGGRPRGRIGRRPAGGFRRPARAVTPSGKRTRARAVWRPSGYRDGWTR